MRERVRVRMAGAEPEKVAEPFGRHLSPGTGIVAVRCKVPCPRGVSASIVWQVGSHGAVEPCTR